MNRAKTLRSTLMALLAVGTALLLAGCERPPMESVQHGFRGTGMVQVYNPRALEAKIEANELPVSLPPASDEGPRAAKAYQNVKVLGDLSVGQFTRLMASMTAWIAPNEGCGYCHNVANFADDSKYTKVVARRMIEMTQHINADWKNHVADTGVTCWTCHRGQPVPNAIWFKANHQPQGSNFIGDKPDRTSRTRRSTCPHCRTIRSPRSCWRPSRSAWVATPRCHRATAPRSSRPSGLTASWCIFRSRWA